MLRVSFDANDTYLIVGVGGSLVKRKLYTRVKRMPEKIWNEQVQREAGLDWYQESLLEDELLYPLELKFYDNVTHEIRVDIKARRK